MIWTASSCVHLSRSLPAIWQADRNSTDARTRSSTMQAFSKLSCLQIGPKSGSRLVCLLERSRSNSAFKSHLSIARAGGHARRTRQRVAFEVFQLQLLAETRELEMVQRDLEPKGAHRESLWVWSALQKRLGICYYFSATLPPKSFASPVPNLHGAPAHSLPLPLLDYASFLPAWAFVVFLLTLRPCYLSLEMSTTERTK